MKKILYSFTIAMLLIICSEQKSAAQVAPGITIFYAGDTMWNSFSCQVPDTLGMYIYGSAGGYLITDSVEIYMAFGDGTDTTFYSLIPQNYFYGYFPHIYTLPGIYSLLCIVTGPDGDDDTLVNNNTIIVASQCGNISGNVYYDSNNDCVNNTGDFDIQWAWVKLLYNGDYINGAYSDVNGNYSLEAPVGFTYTLEVSYYNNANLTATCPAGGTYSISSLPANNKDFGISCGQTGQDLTGNLWAWGVRPGNTSFIYPDYWNNACTAVSGTVTITLPTGVTYITSNPVPTNVNGQVITYNVSPYDFYWNYQWQVNRYIEVLGDVGLVIGDTLCFEMVIDPLAGDLNPSDNTITTCVPVRNSCDPNEKFESHAKWNTANVAPGTQLDYTIAFQNVGNDVAYKVVVVDTLDSDADINTLEITGASHPMNIYMLGTNIMKFEFLNINLPAASVNEPLSHGFVAYKIKPKTGLADGTMIDNKADIFFDFNGSIVTNKVTDVIDIALGVNETIAPLSITAYPNPATEYIRIKMNDESAAVVRLADLSGRIVLEQTVKNNGLVKVGNLASGVYSLQVISGEKNYSGKVVVK
ncbi:MAG TPA: T9SS type A sorting domain-containing protein [Bacteroidia bacterium]|nr:T9SS type A sorting domain-containing protein [Bacteroidia bacterium]